jgi:hypothetical protein
MIRRAFLALVVAAPAVTYARQSGHTTIEAMLRKAGGRE